MKDEETKKAKEAKEAETKCLKEAKEEAKKSKDAEPKCLKESKDEDSVLVLDDNSSGLSLSSSSSLKELEKKALKESKVEEKLSEKKALKALKDEAEKQKLLEKEEKKALKDKKLSEKEEKKALKDKKIDDKKKDDTTTLEVSALFASLMLEPVVVLDEDVDNSSCVSDLSCGSSESNKKAVKNVKRRIISGISYLIDQSGIVYLEKSKEEVGRWDNESQSIKVEDEYEDFDM